jgi:hypothetical protein
MLQTDWFCYYENGFGVWNSLKIQFLRWKNNTVLEQNLKTLKRKNEQLFAARSQCDVLDYFLA